MLQLIVSIPQDSGDPADARARVQHELVHPEDVGSIADAVRAAALGNRSAFALIWDEFHPRVHRFVTLRLRDDAPDAEDVTNEIFLAAWRSLPRYRFTGARFSSWLIAIADRQVLMHVRTAQRRAPVSPLADAPDRIDMENESGDVPIAEALGTLPSDQRRVLELRFLGELTTSEIADSIGRSEAAVRQLQSRGLRALRTALSRDADLLEAAA